MDGNETPLHDREAFQLERVMLFTDAVFAIAITLLIIEIRVPNLRGVRSESAVLKILSELIPKFIGFFTAFYVIAIYWIAHHRIFRHVVRTSPRLIWMNVNFLVSIVLMPFTAAFQSEYPYLKTPWALYCLSVIFTGFMQLRLQQYVRNPAHGVAAPHAHHHPDLDVVRPFISIGTFVLSLLLMVGFDLPWISRLSLFLIGAAMWFYSRRYQRLMREYAGEYAP